jgi:hypothetical protein
VTLEQEACAEVVIRLDSGALVTDPAIWRRYVPARHPGRALPRLPRTRSSAFSKPVVTSSHDGYCSQELLDVSVSGSRLSKEMRASPGTTLALYPEIVVGVTE